MKNLTKKKYYCVFIGINKIPMSVVSNFRDIKYYIKNKNFSFVLVTRQKIETDGSLYRCRGRHKKQWRKYLQKRRTKGRRK